MAHHSEPGQLLPVEGVVSAALEGALVVKKESRAGVLVRLVLLIVRGCDEVADGRFVNNTWKESLLQENQAMTYCGVNAHWQNGIAERRIRDLKEQTRTMLLHAQHHWPDGVTTNLWPYAMQTAGHVFNDAPTLKGDHKDKTPREMFTGMKISAEVRHHHTFGCPVYVTAKSLQ